MGSLVLRIEHVGSTAVPGLAAKPIVDLDVVVSIARVPEAIRGLRINSLQSVTVAALLRIECK
jgi:GrpB-like predicted nucleotidyltransferase (UPF0157 family)